MKTHRIKVCYLIEVSSREYVALVQLGREWGEDYGFKTRPLTIIKRVFKTAGEGALTEISRFMKGKK